MLKDLAEAEANSDFIPFEVRHTRAEMEEHEARRPDPHAMTQNKLLDARKREYLEYNMRNFPHVYKQMPMFSEQEQHWWKMRQTYVAEPWVRANKKKPVTGKVTEVVFPEEDQEPQDFSLPAGGSAIMGRLEHIPRWSQHFLPKGLMDKVPRHFDRLFEGADGVDQGVKKAPSLSTDTAPLDSFSSFRVIRDASRSLSNSVRDDQSDMAVSKTNKSTRTSVAGGGRTTRRESLDSAVPMRTSRSNSFRRTVSKDARRNSRQDLNPTIPILSAMMEDLPMTARVKRSTAEPGAAPPPAPATARTGPNVAQDTARPEGAKRSGVTPEPVEPMTFTQEPLLKVRTGGFQYFDAKGAPVPGNETAALVEKTTTAR